MEVIRITQAAEKADAPNEPLSISFKTSGTREMMLLPPFGEGWDGAFSLEKNLIGKHTSAAPTPALPQRGREKGL
jgi:hypothetical protein